MVKTTPLADMQDLMDYLLGFSTKSQRLRLYSQKWSESFLLLQIDPRARPRVYMVVMQKQLGHEDIQTTLGIYAELTRTRERRVQNKMNDYIMEYITPPAGDEKDASKSG